MSGLPFPISSEPKFNFLSTNGMVRRF
jgi:hypothetical protein